MLEKTGTIRRGDRFCFRSWTLGVDTSEALLDDLRPTGARDGGGGEEVLLEPRGVARSRGGAGVCAAVGHDGLLFGCRFCGRICCEGALSYTLLIPQSMHEHFPITAELESDCDVHSSEVLRPAVIFSCIFTFL